MKDIWTQRARAVSIVGATAVIALYLVYFVTQVQNNKLDQVMDQSREAARLLSTHEKETTDYNQSFKQLLFRICYNTASSDTEKQRCAEAY
jgi:hypothetical protein